MENPSNYSAAASVDGDRGRLEVEGDLDMASVPLLAAEVEGLLSGGIGELEIDLRGVGFVDSSGLRLMIELDARARQEGWKLRLVRPSEAALTVFRISGAESNLPFVEP